MDQFLRTYTLYISGPKYPVYGNNITSAREISDPISIKFELHKSVLNDANFGEITLYNLSPDTEKEIIQQGSEVVLEAGYKDNKGIIFKGQLFQPIRGKSNNLDYYLKLIVIDGDSFINLTWDSETIPANSTKRQLAEQILRSSGNIDTGNINNLPNYNYIDGSEPVTERAKVIFGPPAKYLNDLAKMGNSTFHVDEGQASFFNPMDKDRVNSHIINKDTGMIGLPQQVDNGIEVKVLLNPSIKLGDMIKIDNKSVQIKEYSYGQVPYLLDSDGLYRIIKIDYTGESRGQSWYTKIKAISQNGFTPDMMVKQFGEFIG